MSFFFRNGYILTANHNSNPIFLLDDSDAEDENAAAGDERSNAADVESDGLSLFYDDSGFGGEGMDIEAF